MYVQGHVMNRFLPWCLSYSINFNQPEYFLLLYEMGLIEGQFIMTFCSIISQILTLRLNHLFIQQIFIDHLLCTKHCSFIFLFLFFQGHTCGTWRFTGQGSNWSWSCWPTQQPQQCEIQAVSATYTTAHSNAGSLTH